MLQIIPPGPLQHASAAPGALDTVQRRGIAAQQRHFGGDLGLRGSGREGGGGGNQPGAVLVILVMLSFSSVAGVARGVLLARDPEAHRLPSAWIEQVMLALVALQPPAAGR